MKTYLFAILPILMLGACAKSEPDLPPVRLASVDFEGFHLPGTAVDAKNDGFTQCSDGYSALKCTNARKVSLFGLEADSANIELSTADAFTESYSSSGGTKLTETDLQKLSYRDIEFMIPNVKYDAACLKKYKRDSDWMEPERCKTSGGKDTLRERLLSADWYEGSNRRGWTYYKVGVPVEIYIRSTDVEGVRVSRMGDKAAKSQWEEHAAEIAKKELQKQKSEALINSMKGS